MQIVDLQEEWIEQVARLLMLGFREPAPDAWPDMASALEEVQEALDPEAISRVMLHPEHGVIGWIGGRASYNGRVWELHPLVVHPAWQGQGIGRALIHDFEERVGERGGLTIWLGTDDETDRTSLGGVDLYPDILGTLATIRNLKRHPYSFYERLGFVITGVLPDANGFGKPDIFMAKRVRRG